MVRMDETNIRILQLLQANARMSVTDVAKAVGRSESTVRERITSMEMAGVLLRYEARVDWTQAGLPATAVLRARCDLARLPEVAKQLSAIPNVIRALLMTGPKPVFVMMRVRDLQQLHQILRDHIAPGALSEVDAEIALDSLVERRPPGPGSTSHVTDALLQS
jgi:DNA-binding Lrp family transcriptional regulator